MPFINREPLNGKKRGEKPPPVWRATLRANARQVSPFLTENRRQQPAEIFVNSVSSKQIVRT